ncbi:hypothetical protein BC833DRAFT_623185 [Globomyces pollinis-pini]|nr:hypothetical protein BC833DRAFT_623185 [Globomyces pollinis-pini]KAJ2993122.1 hypothetical protein HDV02_002632 [Globomyces sp. JEL0801]
MKLVYSLCAAGVFASTQNLIPIGNFDPITPACLVAVDAFTTATKPCAKTPCDPTCDVATAAASSNLAVACFNQLIPVTPFGNLLTAPEYIQSYQVTIKDDCVTLDDTLCLEEYAELYEIPRVFDQSTPKKRFNACNCAIELENFYGAFDGLVSKNTAYEINNYVQKLVKVCPNIDVTRVHPFNDGVVGGVQSDFASPILTVGATALLALL